MDTAKSTTQSLLKRLPDNCSLEDIQYHLYVIEKIQQGSERVQTEGAISQEKVEQRLQPWLAE